MIKTKLIPFVCGAGAGTPGCENGPSALNAAGIVSDLRDKGFDIDWAEDPDLLLAGEKGAQAHENADDLGTVDRKNLVMAHVRHLCDKVSETVINGDFPISFGGDHTMAAASVAGFVKAKKAQGRVGLIWVDAHPDLNTLETSPSQAYHGMPVAALLGLGDEDMSALGRDDSGAAALSPAHVCYMGIRDIDAGEEAFINDLGIRRYDMDKINRMGVREAFVDALAYLAPKVDYLCLSFDIDALDPDEGLCVGTPVENGFKKSEIFPVLADILSEYRFDLLEIAEYNPVLEHEPSTRALIRELLTLYLNANEHAHTNATVKIAR